MLDTVMVTRRAFLGTTAAATVGLTLRRSSESFAQSKVNAGRLVIDGLGEIRLDYDVSLLDAIRASGLRGCVVTVGNPALHGSSAFDDMKQEIEGYEAHIRKNPDRLSRVTSVADLDRARERGTIGLIYYTQNATPIQDDLTRVKLFAEMRPSVSPLSQGPIAPSVTSRGCGIADSIHGGSPGRQSRLANVHTFGATP